MGGRFGPTLGPATGRNWAAGGNLSRAFCSGRAGDSDCVVSRPEIRRLQLLPHSLQTHHNRPLPSLPTRANLIAYPVASTLLVGHLKTIVVGFISSPPTHTIQHVFANCCSIPSCSTAPGEYRGIGAGVQTGPQLDGQHTGFSGARFFLRRKKVHNRLFRRKRQSPISTCCHVVEHGVHGGGTALALAAKEDVIRQRHLSPTHPSPSLTMGSAGKTPRLNAHACT